MPTVREELEAQRVLVNDATNSLATRVENLAHQVANGTLAPGEVEAAFAPIVATLHGIAASPAPAPVIPA